MRAWTIWMIRHRMAWLLKIFVIAFYPMQLLSYGGEALDDVLDTLRAIDWEANK